MSESRSGKYLTFTLAGEEYGIVILKVKEIIGMMPITPVPQMPGYVKGVINLRGKVVPVSDLRLKFDMDSIGYTDRTCIIVVEIEGENEMLMTGIVVDAVSEVLSIKEEHIEDPPRFGPALKTEFICGIAKCENKVKILLNIDRVLNTQEMIMLEKAAA